MSDRREPDDSLRMLDDVFEAEGHARAPDRMLEEVFARTRDRGQVRRRPWDDVRMRAIPVWQPGLAVAAVLVIGMVVAFAGAGGRTGPVTQASPPAPAPTATPLASPALTVCATGTGLGGVVPNLWLGCPTGIQRVDVASSQPVLGARYEGVGVPVVGGAGMWAVASGGVVEVDAVKGPGRHIAVPGAAMVAVGPTAVWVATLDDTVVRVDPSTGRTGGTITLGAKPLALAEAGGRVWVAADDGRVHAFAADTLREVATADVGSDAARIGANATAVYVVSQGVEGTVTRVDLATGAVTSRKVSDPNDSRSLGELLASDSAVWLTERGSVMRLDPVTLEIRGTEQLPSYATGLVRDGGSAWVYGEPARLDRVFLP